MLWRFDFGEHTWPPVDDVLWPTAKGFRNAALEVLNAAMPVVDSMEALTALPYGTKLLSSDGNVWWFGFSGGWLRGTRDRYDYEGVDVLADHGPLRVIWTPEAPK